MALCRAITPRLGTLPSRVVIASESPSAKYSSSGAPRFSSGSTTSILWLAAGPESPRGNNFVRRPWASAATRLIPTAIKAYEPARETVDVAPPVDRPAPARLLGTHVRRRSHGDPRLREPPAPGLRDRPRDPEVRHHRLAARQQNVLRFDVAVHHVVAVGVSKGARHLARDPQGLLDRQLTLPLEPVAQRFTFDVRHDVIEEPRRFP